jgi:hypothetical protein
VIPLRHGALDRARVLAGWLRPVDSAEPFRREQTVHAVPERPFLLQVVTVFGGLVAGPFFGHHMGVWLTPGSEVVHGGSLSVAAHHGWLPFPEPE